jgi:two-component system, LytTR family, sensor kinase
MQNLWTPPARWVFGVATVLSLFSTLQAYRLSTLRVGEGMVVEVWRLLALNCALWFVPAALTFAIFRLARRFPVDTGRWVRAVGVHILAALAFSIFHTACLLGVRQLLWGRLASMQYEHFVSFAQGQYLSNLDWALMTYAAIVGLSYALGYYGESRARAVREAHLETRLAQARLKTLEAELQPHFLFNTLHAISTLVHSNPDAADRMISRLSDLLRLTLNRSEAAGVPLQEELEFLQKYLEIEQTRFQDRLSVRYDIDPDTLDAEVPRLILQPLVENAIKHGVSPRTGPGLVEILARRDGADLWLEVRDNGVGLTGGARQQLHRGVGLSNTRDRLECLYQDAHALEFSDGQHGLSVRMRIPFHRAPGGSDHAATRVA